MKIYYDPILGMRYFFEPPVYLIDVAVIPKEMGVEEYMERYIYSMNEKQMDFISSEEPLPSKGWIQQMEEAPVIDSNRLSAKEWNKLLDDLSKQPSTKEGFTICGKHWWSDNNEILIVCKDKGCKTCRAFDNALLHSMRSR